MPEYTEVIGLNIGESKEVRTLAICSTCGATVMDEAQHTQWHQSLVSRLQTRTWTPTVVVTHEGM